MKEEKGKMICNNCTNETDLENWIDIDGEYACPICYNAYRDLKKAFKEPETEGVKSGYSQPEQPVYITDENAERLYWIVLGIGGIVAVIIGLIAIYS